MANPTLTVILTASASPINPGGTSILQWLIPPANQSSQTSVIITNDKNDQAWHSGSGQSYLNTKPVTLTVTTTFTASVVDQFGQTATASVTIVVRTAPVVSFAAVATNAGCGLYNLTWTITSDPTLTSASIDQGIGNIAASGTAAVTDVSGSITYTLTATNALGSTQATATITLATYTGGTTGFVVTPYIKSASTVNFNSSATFAAGLYYVTYQGGAMSYGGTDKWCTGSAATPTNGFYVTDGTQNKYLSQTNVDYATPAACVTANTGLSTTFCATGGTTIGLKLTDSDYTDNAPGTSVRFTASGTYALLGTGSFKVRTQAGGWGGTGGGGLGINAGGGSGAYGDDTRDATAGDVITFALSSSLDTTISTYSLTAGRGLVGGATNGPPPAVGGNGGTASGFGTTNTNGTAGSNTINGTGGNGANGVGPDGGIGGTGGLPNAIGGDGTDYGSGGGGGGSTKAGGNPGKGYVLFDYGSPYYMLSGPSPIVTLSAAPSTIIAGNSAVLSYSTNATASSIDQGIGTVSGTGTTTVSPLTTTTYTLTGTTDGFSTVTATATVTVTPLSAPTQLLAVSTCNAVSLTWTNPAVYTTINVLRSSDNGGIYSQIGTSSIGAYTDTTGTPWTQYLYAVQTVNGAAMGTRTSGVAGTSTAVSSAPTGLTVTAYAGAFGITWTPAAHATTYKLYRGSSSGSETVLVTLLQGAYYYDASVVGSATTWYYKLSGVNTCGESALSSEASGILTVLTPTVIQGDGPGTNYQGGAPGLTPYFKG